MPSQRVLARSDAHSPPFDDLQDMRDYLIESVAARWKTLFLPNFLLAVSTLMLETTARRNWPASLVQPSVHFRWLGEHARWIFERLGVYLAMFTDVFYWLAELFKEDVKNLVTALAYLLGSVPYLLKGYLIYFGEIASGAYDYYAKTTTPTSLGVLGTAIVIFVVAFFVYDCQVIHKCRAIWARTAEQIFTFRPDPDSD